jgi:glycosyltransferase involved in cell wall biosynthesis
MTADTIGEGTTNPYKFSVIGFLLSEIGLGNAARNIVHALRQENLPHNLVNIYMEGRSNDKEFLSECRLYESGNNDIVVSGLADADIIFQELKKLGSGRRSLLYLLWELDRLPYTVFAGLKNYDGVIAPSTFIANAASNFLGVDVPLVKMPVRISKTILSNAISDGKLRILSSMDFDSFAPRKNPQGVLEAFSAAFPVGKFNDVELVLKVRGGLSDSLARKMLHEYAAMDRRIIVIDKTLDRIQMDSLINTCNVYLSLHRSEGFGFGPAEALAAGKIVVSTDYGGTCDFINPYTGFPVAYKLVPVKTGEYPFWENQLWADPIIESAAQSLKEIYLHYELALERAKKGRDLMLMEHSFEVAGKALRALL